MHVQTAVVQGQFAAQGQLRQFLLVQRLAGLAHQRFQQTAFGHGEGQFLLVDTDHAAHRAESQVAQFELAGRRHRMAAAQHGAQAGGEFARVAGLCQVVVSAQLQTQNTVQRLAACREHDHRQVRVFGA